MKAYAAACGPRHGTRKAAAAGCAVPATCRAAIATRTVIVAPPPVQAVVFMGGFPARAWGKWH